MHSDIRAYTQKEALRERLNVHSTLIAAWPHWGGRGGSKGEVKRGAYHKTSLCTERLPKLFTSCQEYK